MDILPIILLYILASVLVIFGIMYVIRKKREKAAGRSPSNKVEDIKAEEVRQNKHGKQ